ncbi:MAG: family 1 encapsulin nanocompartment shell protein [Acidimicrobiia bacterium]
MNHLFRDLAPVSDAAWGEIETEAKRALENFLAARRLVDFTGPHGWTYSASTLGSVEPVPKAPADGVEAALRQVQPVVELRAKFALARAELDAIDRGHKSPDLGAVVDAARSIASAEDTAVFHGYDAANITGIAEASPHDPVQLGDSFGQYPTWVATAVARLRDAGVEGPYGIALGPQCYAGILETTEDGGYPVLERLRLILDGAVVYAPAVNGAVVLSLRGDDFELSCGQDVSIGFERADDEQVHLYLEESFAFHAHSPEAAVALRYPG